MRCRCQYAKNAEVTDLLVVVSNIMFSGQHRDETPPLDHYNIPVICVPHFQQSSIIKDVASLTCLPVKRSWVGSPAEFHDQILLESVEDSDQGTLHKKEGGPLLSDGHKTFYRDVARPNKEKQ